MMTSSKKVGWESLALKTLFSLTVSGDGVSDTRLVHQHWGNRLLGLSI